MIGRDDSDTLSTSFVRIGRVPVDVIGGLSRRETRTEGDPVRSPCQSPENSVTFNQVR